MNYSQVTICTYCRTEADYLLETLPSWLGYPVKNILITDWSSQPPLVDRLREVTKDSRVLVLRVEGREYSWLSKMKNIVGDYATTDFLFFLDPFVWLRRFDVDLKPKVYYHGAGRAKGSCLLSKEAYFKAYGFNEYFITSIGTNDDFYDRLEKREFEKKLMPDGMEHVEHDSFSTGTFRAAEPDIGKVWGRMRRKAPVEYTVQSL
jgi:hypothetical protein